MMMSVKINSVIGSYCLMLIAFACWFNAKSGEAFGTFGFDIHHRYSDTVKEFLKVDGLPEKGTVDYYTAMAHRDQLLKGRRLAASTTPILTFYSSVGNRTYYINNLGYLHYSFLSVGTPSLEFFVALDTGSDLFWLPCDCPNCARNFYLNSGSKIELNIYSPTNSTTSTPVPCNSTKCGPTRGCSTRFNACSYRILDGDTSSTGILVDDILHLGTETNPQDIVDVPITFGCGKNQTGNFLEFAGINGIFGLGMDNISVPSVLANKGLVANSFSLCFGSSGRGRIEFGDKGSPLQKTTPFNLQQPTYNITVTQIAVADNVTDLVFTASFDSSFSYTYLTDPAYSFIVNNFNSRITEKPYRFPGETRMNYCYELSANQSTYITPNLTLTMKGGNKFNVTAPTIAYIRDEGGYAYCLAIIKSRTTNSVIGQNFMEGYRLVFDREEMVLGWKESDCYDAISSKTLAPNNNGNSSRSRPPPPPPTPPPPPPSHAANLSSMTSGLVTVILAIFLHHFIISSS